MPTAIKLSLKTLGEITSETTFTVQELVDELVNDPDRAKYIVKNPIAHGMQRSWLMYTEEEFLEDFTTMPDGIEEKFVKVTQVKAP